MRRSHSGDNNLYLNLLGPPDNPEKASKSLPKHRKTQCPKCIYGIIHAPLAICIYKNKKSTKQKECPQSKDKCFKK